MAAVHQHHERVDGSGYPQGLVDQDIGQLGRISAAAEVVAGVTQHKSKHYLTTVLNANIGRLDRTVLETLTEVLANVSSDDFSQVSDNAATFRLVDTVSDALARWQSLDLQVRSHRDLEKVSGGIAAAQRIVNASGLSTDSLALSDADSMAFVKLSQHTADAFRKPSTSLGRYCTMCIETKRPTWPSIPPSVQSLRPLGCRNRQASQGNRRPGRNVERGQSAPFQS
ncbi:HD domain-containing phosphohydrolase [Methylogaea oryzae]|uniref:HD domain-containing phosphohydrolase n=1 Tax=Methylogaea oryzae TaxID=1295382 RepID=UPI0006D2A4C1|nr:HD domain-containing phosphohydrolase [Methylogaea oryzae]